MIKQFVCFERKQSGCIALTSENCWSVLYRNLLFGGNVTVFFVHLGKYRISCCEYGSVSRYKLFKRKMYHFKKTFEELTECHKREKVFFNAVYNTNIVMYVYVTVQLSCRVE